MSILISLVLVGALFSGCTMLGEDYVAKVGTEKITKSEYNFFLKNAENNITNNGKGVHLNAKENTNEFYLNNFVNNPIQVEHYGVATWNKGSQGNYWNDYTGVDKNKDRIGNYPYTEFYLLEYTFKKCS